MDRWINQIAMFDPADHAARMAGLPADIRVLNRIIQGVLIHADWLAEYGLDETLLHADSRQTLPVAQRLTDVFGRDARPLDVPRPPDRRATGTCRDFALMLCSMLRGNGIPARLRCGFAAYFHDNWEDHWVCEYWDGATQTWHLVDPQLDEIQRNKCHVAFDTTDVPRQSFVTAGEAWLDCRAGRSDANRFGHGETTGMWFLKVNLVRDHYVLNDRVTSLWDTWRSAPPSMRTVSDDEAAQLDELAAFPECALVEMTPNWVA